ncbi:12192_t:CDS:2, partial [Cetraspora pellucida]
MLRAEYDINERTIRTDEHNILNRDCHVRITLQELIGSEGPHSTFHQYCLYASYVQGANFDKYNYSRGKPYEDGTAICFCCMKLIHVNINLGSKANQFDLMKDHYDYECLRPQTEREPSNAQLAWNSLPNDGTPDDKKLLGLMRHK